VRALHAAGVWGQPLPGATVDALLAAVGGPRPPSRQSTDSGWEDTFCTAKAGSGMVQEASARHQSGRGLLAAWRVA